MGRGARPTTPVPDLRGFSCPVHTSHKKITAYFLVDYGLRRPKFGPARTKIEPDMNSDSILPRHEKLALVWSARRERTIAVRVEYAAIQSGGCKIYRLYRIEELG